MDCWYNSANLTYKQIVFLSVPTSPTNRLFFSWCQPHLQDRLFLFWYQAHLKYNKIIFEWTTLRKTLLSNWYYKGKLRRINASTNNDQSLAQDRKNLGLKKILVQRNDRRTWKAFNNSFESSPFFILQWKGICL